MKRAARKQVKKFGKGGLNRYASMMADKLKSPKMSPTERDRIQRAVDQGFTNIVYHSTDTPWDEIDLNYTDVGLHAGTPTQATNRALDKAIQAKLQKRREQGQYIDSTNVMPLAYRPGKTLKMPDVGEFKDAYTTLLSMRNAPELRGQSWLDDLLGDVDYQKSAYPGREPEDWLESSENLMALAGIRQNLRDQGYRQIAYPNTHENAYGELTNLMPEYQDQLDQLSRDADALYQKSLSMRPQAPQPGATEQEIESFLHPRDPLSYLDPEEAALYNKYRNEMQRIEMSPGAYETGESIIFLDPSDVRSVYARFAPEAAQETGLGKKQGGPVYDPSRINQMVDDLLDPMYEFEPYDDEAYEVQRFGKGGLPTPQRQWLKDVVEEDVRPYIKSNPEGHLERMLEMMQRPDYARLPEANRAAYDQRIAEYKARDALNQWLGGTATKYIKRDFGTEFDPMRDLSIRHVQSDVWPPREIGPYSEPARAVPMWWKERNQWVEGLDPETPIYMGLRPGTLEEPGLNIRHLRDELMNAMNAESGLPRNLQIRPESLQRTSFPQASELVGKINQYRAQKMAEEAAAQNTRTLRPYREYPEGYRWVEIAAPQDLPEGWSRAPSGDYITPEGLRTSRGPGERELQEALTFEGDTMGHCVGGYCEDVLEGTKRIYSLRDPQGLPHVTIEVEPNQRPYPVSGEQFAALDPQTKAQYREYVRQWRERNPEINELTDEDVAEALQEAGVAPIPDRILQIKGKQNQAPVGAYLPYVQDFVRSGNWSDVRELENAGMYPADPDYLGTFIPRDVRLQNMPGRRTDDLRRAMESGLFEGRKYVTRDEWENILRRQIESESGPLGDVSGMKEGGEVKTKSMLDELLEAVLAGSAGFGAQVTPDEYGNRGLVSATLSTPELLGLIPGGAQYIPAASGVASADYDEHLNNMLARYGLAESADLDTLDKFALAMGETVGQIPILPARGVAALKRFAPALFKSRTIPGARAVDITTKPIRAAAEYFSPTAEISPSMLAAATGIGGGLRTYFGNDPIAEPSNDADYDDLMQMLRRNAAIDLPSTRELTAKMPARPMRERMAYTPPSFPGMAKGGQVYDPARIESMVNELMEPQKLAKGGLGRATIEAEPPSSERAMTAADRAAAGRRAADLIKAEEVLKASEALGRARERGISQVTATQSDRTRVGGGNIGGALFPAISRADPNYEGYVWGVGKPTTASRLINIADPGTAFTTMLNSAEQLKTNPIVFDKLKRGFLGGMKAGLLTDDLASRINQNLAITFGEGADIKNPRIWSMADTFDKRAALADVMMGKGKPPLMGGVALGGEKSGKGVIFNPSEILRRETEPELLHPIYGGDVPTHAVGPRMFTLQGDFETRPDLHPAFPVLLKGEDLGMRFKPVPIETFMPDWHNSFAERVGARKPGFYDYALGLKGVGLPSQAITDEYLKRLMTEGFADGGKVSYLQHMARN